MNIRDFASQFTVYTYSSDIDRGASIRGFLAKEGYDVFYLQDLNMLEQRVQDTAPHIVVLDLDDLKGSLGEFLNHMLEINFEMKFILLSDSDQFQADVQSSAGISEILFKKIPFLEARVLWAVDRICEKLYLTYQNEQLFDDLQEAKSRIDEVHTAAVKSMKQVENPPLKAELEVASPLSERSRFSLTMRRADYQTSQSGEELIQKFLNQLKNSVCIYFKFLPSIKSFVAASANGVSIDRIQGLGVQLEGNDLRDLPSQLAVGQLPSKFYSMLSEAFQLKNPKVLPLYASQTFEGIFIYSGDLPADSLSLVSEEFALFTLCYSNFFLEKKVSVLEVQDYVTELYNRTYFLKVLADEVTRARRYKLPLSVVKVCIDSFSEMEEMMGEIVRDEIIKSVAQLISKSSRVSDINCRSGFNEISLILPHCSKKGAALRSERVRRMVEANSLMDNGLRLTVSIGISEYPTLCDSAKTLDETSSKAMRFIAERSGNKICLYKASESFKPEYEVPQE